MINTQVLKRYQQISIVDILKCLCTVLEALLHFGTAQSIHKVVHIVHDINCKIYLQDFDVTMDTNNGDIDITVTESKKIHFKASGGKQE